MNEECNEVVIIDDDPTNNLIFKIVLRHLCKPCSPQISDFVCPEKGVIYLTSRLQNNKEPVILFLDINMPLLTGWDVLNKLQLLPSTAKEWLTVFMLSSSINPEDENRAMKHPLVKRFINKPVTTDMCWLKEALFKRTSEELHRTQQVTHDKTK